MLIKKTPEKINLDITSKCNLRCKHCCYFSGTGDVKRDLPTEEWLAFFDELGSCAIRNVTFCGGEPFFREDIKELIQGVIRNRMRFCVLTNGTLITDEIAAFIASTPRCDYVQISIDGSIPQTHDALRGKGNFEKAIDGLKCLKKYQVPLHVRLTIFKGNVNELEEIAELLLEEIGLPNFSVNSASYHGLCKQNAEMIQLTIEERTKAMEKLVRLERKYKGRILATAGSLSEAKFWIKMVQAYRAGKKDMPGRGFLRGCNCSFSMLSVCSDGVIVPCSLLSHIELGRINKDNLREIWQNHPELLKLRQRRNIPLSKFEFCKKCEYVNYCTGGCPANAYSIINNANHPSPDFCLKLFLEQGGRLPDEKLFEPADLA